MVDINLYLKEVTIINQGSSSRYKIEISQGDNVSVISEDKDICIIGVINNVNQYEVAVMLKTEFNMKNELIKGNMFSIIKYGGDIGFLNMLDLLDKFSNL